MTEITRNFPIPCSDPAYGIDRNPNSIRIQRVRLRLARNPVKAASASCVPMGMIGIAPDGVAIFNAVDATGKDGVAHKVQDQCSGHLERDGTYHDHGPAPAFPASTARRS